MITAKEVAAKLGLSASTVSLVLNNKPGISDATRRRVLETLDEMGYREMQRKQAGRRDIIQFVLYKKHGKVVADTPFFTKLLEGVENQARSLGFHLMFSHLTRETARVQIHSLLDSGCCGIILLATEMEQEDLALFQQTGLPLVVLDNYWNGVDAEYVLINNGQGAYRATAHLAELGHRRIGYLRSSIVISNFSERRRGYRQALQDFGITPDPDWEYALSPVMEETYPDMKRLMESGRTLPTAFFADNDNIALGAVRAIQEAGYRVPEDISIIGFDDMPHGEIISPPLTTLRVHKQAIGSLAVDRLAVLLAEPNPIFTKTEVATTLILRGSTGVVAE